jgi:hypothetical protein
VDDRGRLLSGCRVIKLYPGFESLPPRLTIERALATEPPRILPARHDRGKMRTVAYMRPYLNWIEDRSTEPIVGRSNRPGRTVGTTIPVVPFYSGPSSKPRYTHAT